MLIWWGGGTAFKQVWCVGEGQDHLKHDQLACTCLGRLLVLHYDCAPLHKPPVLVVTALELAAVGYIGLGLQQSHRFTAQFMEQDDSGQHTLHVALYVHCVAIVKEFFCHSHSTCLEMSFLVTHAHVAAEHRCKR